ncbi:190_t:CDS:2, partial [Racocetra persica]
TRRNLDVIGIITIIVLKAKSEHLQFIDAKLVYNSHKKYSSLKNQAKTDGQILDQ